jgi:hypothetical protein
MKEKIVNGHNVYVVEDKDLDGVVIDAISSRESNKGKKRLFLDVDGTLVAKKLKHYVNPEDIWPYDGVAFRTDFCH